MKKINFLLFFITSAILTSCSNDSNEKTTEFTAKNYTPKTISFEAAKDYAKIYSDQLNFLELKFVLEDFKNNDGAIYDYAFYTYNNDLYNTNKSLTIDLDVPGSMLFEDLGVDEVYTYEDVEKLDLSAIEKEYMWKAYELSNKENYEDLIKLTDEYKNAVVNNSSLESLSIYFAFLDINRASFLAKGPCDKQIIRGAAKGGAKGMIKGAIKGGITGTVLGMNPGTGAAGAVIGAVGGGLLGFVKGAIEGYRDCLEGKK